MNRIFDITTASEHVSIGGDGRGEITFTVTNGSRRPLRGQLRVKPFGSTKGEWLNIAGETERVFSPNATQQVVVKVATPPGVPEGKYQFRLDAISVINPDEDFTEGPTIDFEIKAPEAPKKAFPWWIVAAAAGAVILVVTLTWWLWPRGIEVPEVVGLDVAEATKKLEGLKFKVEVTRQPNASVAAGQVFAQEPAGKSKVEEGASVTLLAAELKAAEQKPAEQKPAEQKPAEQKVVGPIVVFEDHFESGAKPGWSQTKTELAPNRHTKFLGQFFNDAIVLTLSNLPPHKTVTLKHDLYILHTWDGEVAGDGPDSWGVNLAGSAESIFTSFSNQDGGKQKFICRNGEEVSPACQSGSEGAAFGTMAVNSLGFNPFPWLKYKDSTYKIKRTFTHDKSTLSLTFYGKLSEMVLTNRNIGNESWGLDNVRIEIQ
jgi:hypothetical protein